MISKKTTPLGAQARLTDAPQVPIESFL